MRSRAATTTRVLTAAGGVSAAATPRSLRYDLATVEAVEAFAAEGLATLRGRLPEGAGGGRLHDVLLAALRSHLGFRGERRGSALARAVFDHPHTCC